MTLILQEDAQRFEWAWANPLKAALLKSSRVALLWDLHTDMLVTHAGKVLKFELFLIDLYFCEFLYLIPVSM